MLDGGLKRCLPRLIIMGQFKCGTTALFDTLAQHPDILLPHTKQPNQIKCPRRQPTCVIKEVNGARRRSAAARGVPLSGGRGAQASTASTLAAGTRRRSCATTTA